MFPCKERQLAVQPFGCVCFCVMSAIRWRSQFQIDTLMGWIIQVFTSDIACLHLRFKLLFLKNSQASWRHPMQTMRPRYLLNRHPHWPTQIPRRRLAMRQQLRKLQSSRIKPATLLPAKSSWSDTYLPSDQSSADVPMQVFLTCSSVDLVALMDQTTLAASLNIVSRALGAGSKSAWIAGAYFL